MNKQSKSNSLPKKALSLLSYACLGFVLAACQSTEQVPDKTEVVTLEMCPETRPQMCTMEYMPVCGSKVDSSTKTYGNACGACGDADVTGYVVGECEAE